MKELRCKSPFTYLLYIVGGVSFVSEESSGNRIAPLLECGNRSGAHTVGWQASRCKRNSWFRKRLIWGEFAAHFLKVVPLLPDDSIGLFIEELGNGVPVPLGEFVP